MKQITPEQVASYRENGFVTIPGFLDAGELEHWSTATDRAVRDRLAQTRADFSNQHNPDDYYSQVFIQCIRLADTDETMHEIIFDPRLGEAAATLAGIDGIRIWHDQALFKPPYGNPTAWHLDNPYWSFSSRDAISIWVALDDATLENGCMWYLPGTHRTARWENSGIGQNMRDLFKIYPEWMDLTAVSAPARAGDAVFHNGLVAHGAGANMTPGSRRAMTCGYMPDGATFNGVRNILPQEYFESLQIGDVLDNDAQNPLVWSRATAPVA